MVALEGLGVRGKARVFSLRQRHLFNRQQAGLGAPFFFYLCAFKPRHQDYEHGGDDESEAMR